MAAIFGEGKIFLKLPRVQCSDTLWVENFDEIALSHTVKEIEANLCFAFLAKIRKFKMATIFGEGKIFGKLQRLHSLDALWVENFAEISLSRTVKEIEANLCFAIFGKNSKIQNCRHFWGGENFGKLQRLHSLDTLWVENFDEIALSRTVKEIQADLCFAIFGKNSKIQNGRHFWGGENFFGKLQSLHSLDTLWVENFDEIALSRTVKEIQADLCFTIFGKNSKIQNGRHFWGGENFLKIAKIPFLRYPVGRKFRRNRSISHG